MTRFQHNNCRWNSGFSAHFGLVHVDHTRADLRRTVKKSGRWYQGVVQRGGFDSEMINNTQRVTGDVDDGVIVYI